MANPALGRLIDPEELRRDYEQSKTRGQTELAECKMYRGNIWQKGANPWLRASDWDACRREFTEADLAGGCCWAGLDLSRTRDMTALVLVFAGEEETFQVLPYFWLPEDRAAEIEHLCPVRQWAAQGAIELTPGGVTDYGFVRSRFRQLAETFSIQELAYDPRFAEETTQALAEGVRSAEGDIIEEGTGVTRFVFAQSDENFAAPTEDFERLVLAGKLHHNGHPVLSWQAGHATVIRRMATKVKRVVKPKASGHLTVDGIVSGIMALARATQGAVAEELSIDLL